MTNELEKQFFNTFNIEPIGCNDNKNCTGTLDCRTQCPNAKYPEITDRILLELICLFAKEMNCFTNYWHTVKDLKKDVLEEFILDKNSFSKHQIQALFKEER